MQNQGLGRQSEKICAESATKTTPDTPQFIRPIAQSAKTFGMCLKKDLTGRP